MEEEVSQGRNVIDISCLHLGKKDLDFASIECSGRANHRPCNTLSLRKKEISLVQSTAGLDLHRVPFLLILSYSERLPQFTICICVIIEFFFELADALLAAWVFASTLSAALLSVSDASGRSCLKTFALISAL